MFAALGLGSASGSGTSPGQGAPKDSAPSSSSKGGWELSLGPLSLGSKGVELKPQFKVGAQVANFKAEAGLGDLRDGVKLGAKAEASVEAQAEGQSLAELHENIRCDTAGFRQALATAKQLLGRGSGALRQVAQTLGLKEGQLEEALTGKLKLPGSPPMILKVKAALGIGAGAQVCLGWCDTKGYHRVGIGGGAASAVEMGGSVFAGRHSSGASCKVILGIGNFTFEYTIHLSCADSGVAESAKP
ncbi:unnamed protein product [Polarella glacialis]|uniref:Uncharacterized protein n=1 Tax=Polarella glacialis TaxID=89957 RepID=A0A813D9A6_POLGL|nr:unnamed protein product [Polarella glacialis]